MLRIVTVRMRIVINTDLHTKGDVCVVKIDEQQNLTIRQKRFGGKIFTKVDLMKDIQSYVRDARQNVHAQVMRIVVRAIVVLMKTLRILMQGDSGNLFVATILPNLRVPIMVAHIWAMVLNVIMICAMIFVI